MYLFARKYVKIAPVHHSIHIWMWKGDVAIRLFLTNRAHFLPPQTLHKHNETSNQWPYRKFGSHLSVHFKVRQQKVFHVRSQCSTRSLNVLKRLMSNHSVLHGYRMFWNVWRSAKHNTYDERPGYLPHHKTWLAIGDNFIGLSSSCGSHNFLQEHFN